MLVRPDVPIAASDDAAYLGPVWSGEPLVASTHTQHSAGRWGYVVSCNVGAEHQPCRGRVSLPSLGEDRPSTPEVAVFDWRRRRVDVLPADGEYETALEPSGWDYRVLAPVIAGVAVIGDQALYACAGDARIADVVADPDGAGLTVTVLGANEHVSVGGWSQGPITAQAWAPSVGTRELGLTYDASSGLWAAALTVGAAGWVKVHLHPRR